MSRHPLRAAAAAFAMTMTLLAPGPATAQQKTQVTQLLAIGIQLGHIREFVAKGMGFYDEEGLDVTLQPAPGSATEIQYMTAGRGTLGSIDVHMAVEQRKAPQGLKMRAVFSHLQSGVTASPPSRAGRSRVRTTSGARRSAFRPRRAARSRSSSPSPSRQGSPKAR